MTIINMLGRQQLNLNYKLAPLYSEKLQQIGDSKVSFRHFDTPGWTSVMHTQSASEAPPEKKSLHSKIMERLNRMEGVDLTASQLNNVRSPQSQRFGGKEVITSRGLKTEGEGQKQNLMSRKSIDRLARPKKSVSQKTLSHRSRVSYAESSPGRQAKSGRHTQASDKNKGRKQQKRFHHITVHEHLYLDGIKQQKKHIIERILDQEYEIKNVAPFKPSINPKSEQLAQVHYSRVRAKQELQDELSTAFEKTQETETSEYRQSPQESQFRALHQLFLYLSQSQNVLSISTAKGALEELPLMCIKAMDKLIEKLYQGETFTWLEFLGSINDKKIVGHKKGLLKVLEKWVMRKQAASTGPATNASRQ